MPILGLWCVRVLKLKSWQIKILLYFGVVCLKIGNIYSPLFNINDIFVSFYCDIHATLLVFTVIIILIIVTVQCFNIFIWKNGLKSGYLRLWWIVWTQKQINDCYNIGLFQENLSVILRYMERLLPSFGLYR